MSATPCSHRTRSLQDSCTRCHSDPAKSGGGPQGPRRQSETWEAKIVCWNVARARLIPIFAHSHAVVQRLDGAYCQKAAAAVAVGRARSARRAVLCQVRERCHLTHLRCRTGLRVCSIVNFPNPQREQCSASDGAKLHHSQGPRANWPGIADVELAAHAVGRLCPQLAPGRNLGAAARATSSQTGQHREAQRHASRCPHFIMKNPMPVPAPLLQGGARRCWAWRRAMAACAASPVRPHPLPPLGPCPALGAQQARCLFIYKHLEAARQAPARHQAPSRARNGGQGPGGCVGPS